MFGEVNANPVVTLCQERFEVATKLGEGTYGEVFYAFDRSKQCQVALKRVKFHGQESQGIPPTTIREIAILKELKHKNIVGLEDVIMNYTESGSPQLFLVFKMMNCDLKKFIKMNDGKLPEMAIKNFLYQIIEGVDYLHANKVFHRDLKPENVLLSQEENRVKICDFGLARTVHQPLRPYTEEVMSLWYRAPELCISNKNYSVGVDTWAIGCIFAEMVTGRPLFIAKQTSELLLQIIGTIGNPKEGLSSLPENMRAVLKNIHDRKDRSLSTAVPGLDTIGLDLLEKLLILNPLARYTCKQALEHPYFREVRQI